MTRKATNTSVPNDLRTKAMLVRLRINRWGAKVNDSEAAGEVARNKHADPELGRYTKLLLKSDALDMHRKTARACRKRHKFYTLPWDEGVGLLPAELYFEYTKAIGELQREAEKYARQFVEEYKAQWNNGLGDYKKGLGEMFNEDDYPDPSRVKSKFGIHIRAYPIENPNDFRVKMSADVSDDIKKQMRQDMQSNLQDALRVPVTRLYEVVSHVQEKLNNGDAVFRDSLIGNVEKLVDILPALNVTNDPQIDKLIKQTDKEICGVSDMKALRTDPAYRKQVAKSASDILKQMKGYVS